MKGYRPMHHIEKTSLKISLPLLAYGIGLSMFLLSLRFLYYPYASPQALQHTCVSSAIVFLVGIALSWTYSIPKLNHLIKQNQRHNK